MLLPDVLNTRQFTWVWVVKINAIWIGRAKVCTLEEDDVFIISTCCIKYHSMVMYISSAVNYFRSMCKSNDSLCIVIYILYKELEYYIPEDSCVNLEKSVAFQKCSEYQPLSLLLCWEVSFQSTWLLDYSKVKQLPEASSPIWLISFQMWNSSLDCIGSEEMLTWSMIQLLNDSLLPMNVHISSSYFYTMLCYLCCDFTCEFMPRITTWRTLGYLCGIHL